MSHKCECSRCGQSTAEFMSGIAKHIKEYGWVCMHIEPHCHENGETFTYTIGNRESGMPELFMGVNVRREVAHSIMINVILEWRKNGVKLGRNSEILHGADVELVETHAAQALGEYMDQHREYYGKKHDTKVVQILLPDIDGNLPSDVGYEMPQILLNKAPAMH